MELSRNAKGAVAFVVPTVALMVHDVVGMYHNPEWGRGLPEMAHNMMPFMFNVALPVVFLVAGFAMMLGLNNERKGFILIIALAVFNIVMNVPVTFARLAEGFAQGAAICGIEAVIGVLSLYYAVKALRETSGVTASTRRTSAESAAG